MYTIATLNKISPVGLARLSDQYEVKDGASGVEGASGILVRSQNMLEMEFAPELLAIARAGAGVNNIPLNACADAGIVVFNTPGANANAVKELVIAAMLVAARNIYPGIRWVNEQAADPAVTDISKTVEKGKGQFAGHEIAGKRLGLLGLGAIGAKVADSALALGMSVSGYDPFLSETAAARLDPRVEIIKTPEELLPACDYVTIHIPATKDTTGMFDEKMLGLCKDGAVLLNFSRDKLVVESAIVDAVTSGKLKTYVTDFITSGIAGLPNVICMPHLGASTEEAEDNCAMMACDELMDYLERGNIVNSVNMPRVNLGELTAAKRLAVITKGLDPAALLGELAAGKAVAASASGKRGDYGYLLLDTDSEVTAPEGEGILRARVLAK